MPQIAMEVQTTSTRVVITRSEQETRTIAEEFGQQLSSGAVVALSGPLGSGKTTFVKGLCQGLGVTAPVNSPSFIIENEYPGRVPVYHWDLYRLETLESIQRLGAEELFAAAGVCVIEWAEKAGPLLPLPRWEITFEIASDIERKISLYFRVI